MTAITVNTGTARAYTNAVIEAVESGVVDTDTLVRDLLNFMSEHDVQEFCEHYLSDVISEEDDELDAGFDFDEEADEDSDEDSDWDE